MTGFDQLLESGDGIATDRHAFDVECEVLVGELARGVVVAQRDFCARDAQILRLYVQSRQGNEWLQLLFQVPNGDQSGLWRASVRGP
jgi:hypothetical protein